VPGSKRSRPVRAAHGQLRGKGELSLCGRRKGAPLSGWPKHPVAFGHLRTMRKSRGKASITSPPKKTPLQHTLRDDPFPRPKKSLPRGGPRICQSPATGGRIPKKNRRGNSYVEEYRVCPSSAMAWGKTGGERRRMALFGRGAFRRSRRFGVASEERRRRERRSRSIGKGFHRL